MANPKPESKPDDKEQSERFIKKARELNADEAGQEFDRAFTKLVPPKKAKPHGHK
jgi:hypothetical protein